jgi:hypothetical protein
VNVVPISPPAAWARIPPDPSLPPERREWHASWPHKDYVELAAEAAAASSAHRRLRESLRQWGLSALCEDAELVTAELVSNAVAATQRIACELGRPPVRLWTMGSRAAIVALAWDASAQAPRLGTPSPDAESGRGLILVDALAEWGHYRPAGTFGGKVVWARIPRQREAGRGRFLYDYRCSRGFTAGTARELTGHLLKVLTPENDQGHNGKAHAGLTPNLVSQSRPRRRESRQIG